MKWSNVKIELTSPGVSTQLRHRVPPFPQLTNLRLQTTAVGLSAPYEPHGNREYGRTRLLSGVLSEWRSTGMQWKKSDRTKNHLTNINDRPVFPGYLTGCSAATTPVPENWRLRGVVPREGYTTLANSTKFSDVRNMLYYYWLVKKKVKRRSLLSWWLAPACLVLAENNCCSLLRKILWEMYRYTQRTTQSTSYHHEFGVTLPTTKMCYKH